MVFNIVLNFSNENKRQKLIKKLKSWGDVVTPFDCSVFVSVDNDEMNATDLYRELKKEIGLEQSDHVVVMRIDTYNERLDRNGWMPRSFWQWLKEQLVNS